MSLTWTITSPSLFLYVFFFQVKEYTVMYISIAFLIWGLPWPEFDSKRCSFPVFFKVEVHITQPCSLLAYYVEYKCFSSSKETTWHFIWKVLVVIDIAKVISYTIAFAFCFFGWANFSLCPLWYNPCADCLPHVYLSPQNFLWFVNPKEHHEIFIFN